MKDNTGQMQGEEEKGKLERMEYICNKIFREVYLQKAIHLKKNSNVQFSSGIGTNDRQHKSEKIGNKIEDISGLQLEETANETKLS